MSRRYIRAHPQSKLGENYTKAHTEGWMLVGFVSMYGMDYPVFKETFKRWFIRVILRYEKNYGKGD